jgi:cytosine/adenosine deaminase-related metal-dependent hydrolase
MTILIKDCSILDEDSPYGFREGMNILVEDNRIARISSSPIAATDADRTLPGKDLLAMPGMVNAHAHSPENYLRGLTEGVPLELWLFDFFSSGVRFSPRESYLAAAFGAAEMLRTGTTTVLDHFWVNGGMTIEDLDAVMEAYRDVGIRAAVAPLVEDLRPELEAAIKNDPDLSSQPENYDSALDVPDYLEMLEAFFEKWHRSQNGRLRCLAGPSGPQWCSDKVLYGSAEIAARFQGGLHMHTDETKLQALLCREIYGSSSIMHMHRQGLLGPHVTLAHCVWVDDRDVEILAETGATVVHNPASNLKLGSGFAPIPDMKEKGVSIALGADGSASSDNQLLFDIMKLTGLIHNAREVDHRRWVSARDVVTMATVGGAKGIGLDGELGALKPGMLADIVLLRLDASFFAPLNDAFRQLVYCENGSSVETVIVDGRIVVDQGRLSTLDEHSVLSEFKEAWEQDKESIHPLTGDDLKIFHAMERFQAEQSAREFYLSRH